MTDLRYAIRFLWTHKAFTAAAILTLAIGLGANTALYGMLNATLRPLPLPDPDRLVVIAAEPKGDETGGFQFAFSTEQLKDLQERAEAFSDVVGFMPRIGGLLIDGKPSQFWYAAVSDNYFGGLRVRPPQGTLFTAESGSPVHVVLGHSFWMKHFGGDPNVIGKPVRVDGVPAVVTGVVERSFRGTVTAVEMDGYVAIEDYGVPNPESQRWLYRNRKARSMQCIARLRPGVSVGEAQAVHRCADARPSPPNIQRQTRASSPSSCRNRRAARCRCAPCAMRCRSSACSAWRSPVSCCCWRA